MWKGLSFYDVLLIKVDVEVVEMLLGFEDCEKFCDFSWVCRFVILFLRNLRYGQWSVCGWCGVMMSWWGDFNWDSKGGGV